MDRIQRIVLFIRKEFSDPLYNPAKAFPASWRNILNWVLVSVIFFFCYFVWWTKFHWLRNPLWLIMTVIYSVLEIGGFIADGIAKEKDAEARQDNEVKDDKQTQAHEGGWYFLGLIILMLLWWILSSYTGNTVEAKPRWLVVKDRTLWTQGLLAAFAIRLLWRKHARSRVLKLERHRLQWVLSYSMFFTAMLMMIADTDYQFKLAEHPIDWDKWIRWRILNYALILPYLGAGIAVVNGCSLKWLCSLGCVAVLLVGIALVLTGIQI